MPEFKFSRSQNRMNLNNNIDMTNFTSRLIVEDYVAYRLGKERYTWPDGRAACREPTKVNKTMRILGDEFEERYRQVFHDMCNQLHITPSTAYSTFLGVVNELFSDGIKWGRIVALFAFGGALCVQCISREMPQLVNNIVEWVIRYVDTHLASWIIQNGGWDGFVEFYEGGKNGHHDDAWPSWLRVCGYAAGIAGMVAVGASLIQKT